MENPYASLVLEEVIRSCSLLAVDFANIQANQVSNESEKIKKCMQWQETLQQIDCALHFIEIEDLSALIKKQKQVISAVAKGDLASSTQLLTLLSKTQHATSLLLENKNQGLTTFPITLFSGYSALHQILFQDEVSAASLILLPNESDLPLALKALSHAAITDITLAELSAMYESALLMILKHESEVSIKSAAEELAIVFSNIAILQKEKHSDNLYAVSSKEQLYSQIFQLYALKIAEGENLDLRIARKIFSAMRRKIYQLSVDPNLTFRGELLQEVLFELSRVNHNDSSVTEVLNAFDIERQLALLIHGQTIWDEIESRNDAWGIFSNTVEQTRNEVLVNYSEDKSTVSAIQKFKYLHSAIENMMKLASLICEPLLHSLKNWRALFDSSSINEQEFNKFLAYLILLEQIALNKQEWTLSPESHSKLIAILGDVQVNPSEPGNLIKLGGGTQFLEKRNADQALLIGLRCSLVSVESKLDSIFIVGLIENDKKIIQNYLEEIISVIDFLNNEKLRQDFSSLKNLISEFLKHDYENQSLVEKIVEKFLLFEKEFNIFFLNYKNSDEIFKPVINVIENKKNNEDVENKNEVIKDQIIQDEVVKDQVFKNELVKAEIQLNNQELYFNQNVDESLAVASNALSPAPIPLIASPALQKIYFKEAQQLILQLDDVVQRWLAAPDENLLQIASHAAHSLAGSSATVGVPAMSALSTALEQVLHVLDDTFYMEVKSSDLLMQSVTALASQLQDLSSGYVPDLEIALIGKLFFLRDQLSTKLVGGGVAPELSPLNEDETSCRDSVQSYSIDDEISADSATAPIINIDQTADPIILSQPVIQAVSIEADLVQSEEVFTDYLEPIRLMEEDAPDAELVAIFIEEATDFFPQLDILLRNLVDSPKNPDSTNAILRILHTLKGGARMAGCTALGQHFHQMESEVEQLAHIPDGSGESISQLMQAFDFALSALAKLKIQVQMDDVELQNQLVNQVDKNAFEQQETQPTIVSQAAIASQDSILLRVRTDALDRLAGSAAELIVDGARMSAEIQQQKKSLLDLTDTLIRLRSQFRELELVAESNIISKTQASQQLDFDPLEFDRFTRLQELTRMMAESMSDAANIERGLSRHVEKTHAILYSHEKYARAIQNDLKRVRVVRFASVSERLHHLVRQVAREYEREVRLEITGSQSEIDRSLLDKIISPIEHLLRNAITHGIESSEERLHAGKEKCGLILINLLQQGNEIVITVSDDGRGLDFVRIQDRARKNGFIGDGCHT